MSQIIAARLHFGILTQVRGNRLQATKSISASLRDLRGSPDVMKAFVNIAQSALEANALDTKTKELIALAIGIATPCATDEEVFETLRRAIYMGAGPSVMYFTLDVGTWF